MTARRSVGARAQRLREVVPFLGFAAVVSAGAVLLREGARPLRIVGNAERFAYGEHERAQDDAPGELWTLASFALLDQGRKRVDLGSLRGEPFVADFIFTQCASACPLMTSHMVRLQSELHDRAVRFVSFAVDPEHDTPEALAAYARRWNPDETRWSLLAMSEADVRAVAETFRVSVMQTPGQSEPLVHSSVFFLVDGESAVRGVYSSNDPGALARLLTDTRALAAQREPAPDGGAASGGYATLGCAGCHDDVRVAPPLMNLLGATRTLEGGATVTIDEAYLRRAILEPQHDVVRGYLPMMPSYRERLGDVQLTNLVSEIQLRTDGSAAHDAGASRDAMDAELALDPVCQMKVRATPESPHLMTDTGIVYFCSDMCRHSYVKAHAKGQRGHARH